MRLYFKIWIFLLKKNVMVRRQVVVKGKQSECGGLNRGGEHPHMDWGKDARILFATQEQTSGFWLCRNVNKSNVLETVVWSWPLFREGHTWILSLPESQEAVYLPQRPGTLYTLPCFGNVWEGAAPLASHPGLPREPGLGVPVGSQPASPGPRWRGRLWELLEGQGVARPWERISERTPEALLCLPISAAGG